MRMKNHQLIMRLLSSLIITLLAAIPAHAQQAPPAFKHPLQQKLESQILPEVRFENADFTDALHYLQLQALASSQNTMKVPFIVQLPADFKPRYHLTLDLKAIPFWEALRHLGGQAGVEFTIAKNSVLIRPSGAESAAKPAVTTAIPAPEVHVPSSKALPTLLAKKARPFGSPGGNNHYTTSGEPQPQRSGNKKHRNLSGWSVEQDPRSSYSMNCIDLEACKARRTGPDGKCACGCFACACHR